jgi:hypothetical protein
VTIFVPGPIRNPLNGSHGHWSKHARWVKTERERTAYLILKLGWPAYSQSPTVPKRVDFLVYVARRFDDDNLAAACKPYRDALKDMRVIDDDGPARGHEFHYRQVVSKTRGIEITVTPR